MHPLLDTLRSLPTGRELDDVARMVNLRGDVVGFYG